MKLVRWAVILLILIATLTLTACQPDEVVPVMTATAAPTSAEGAPAFNSLQEEEAYWRQQTEDYPDDAKTHYQLGLVLMVLSPEEAAGSLAQAADLNPGLEADTNRLRSALRQSAAVGDLAYQHTLIGQALASIEEWNLAEAALENAVGSNPEYPEAWAYLGEARQHTDADNALEALKTAHSLDPDSLSANLFLSLYYQRQSAPRQALPYLRAALEHDPANLAMNQNLAQTLVDAGMVEQAFDHLQSLVDANPARAERWIALATLSLDNQLMITEIGLPAAREAALLAPEDPQTDLLLGRAYLQDGNLVLAERFLSKAVEASPSLAAPHYYLGILYLNSDRLAFAEEHLRNAQTLAEENGDPIILELAENILTEYFP